MTKEIKKIWPQIYYNYLTPKLQITTDNLKRYGYFTEQYQNNLLSDKLMWHIQYSIDLSQYQFNHSLKQKEVLPSAAILRLNLSHGIPYKINNCGNKNTDCSTCAFLPSIKTPVFMSDWSDIKGIQSRECIFRTIPNLQWAGPYNLYKRQRL